MNVLILPIGVAMLRNMSELHTQTPGGEDAANYRHKLLPTLSPLVSYLYLHVSFTWFQ